MRLFRDLTPGGLSPDPQDNDSFLKSFNISKTSEMIIKIYISQRCYKILKLPIAINILVDPGHSR